MKCGCEMCEAFMVHVEKGEDSYCLCPECGHQCRDCLGGDNPRFTFLDRDTVRRMKKETEK